MVESEETFQSPSWGVFPVTPTTLPWLTSASTRNVHALNCIFLQREPPFTKTKELSQH